MDHGVCSQVAALAEAPSAHVTRIGPVAAVRAHVVVKVQAAQKHLAALVTAVQAATLMYLTGWT